MPLSVIFVGMVVFNNLCLKYVEVSFYQVARSLTILCNIALTYVVLGKSTSPLALAVPLSVHAAVLWMHSQSHRPTGPTIG